MKILATVIALLLLCAVGSGGAEEPKGSPETGAPAEGYEIPADRHVSEILPASVAQGPHYRIRDKVVCYGYMQQYTVDSDFGEFEVAGDGALRKLLKEIKAIGILREVKKGKAYLEAVKSATLAPFEFGKDIITDPVDTVTGVPKGVYHLFRNIGTNLTTERDPSEDNRTKTLLQLSTYKRQYAHELGVDVYSSNPVLQKELNSVGWAGAAGSLSVSAALAPFGGPGFMAVKAVRLSDTFNDMVKAEPPARLRQINREKLEKMGISQELSEKFLDHQSYTPTHDTVIVGSLEMLGGARGRETFLNLALTANDEESANFFQNMAETLRGYHLTVSPIRDITVTFGLVFARAEDGSVLIPFPLDRGVWTERAAWVIPNAIDSYKEAIGSQSVGKLELWVTGTVTPLAKTQVAKFGINVTEDVDKRIEFMN